MYTFEKTVQVYLDLAEMYHQQQDAGMREVFLLLAADTALRSGKTAQSEQLRQELLRNNPYHVLKPFPTFVEAAQHPDIQNYLDDLRMKYPPEVAEDLLESIIPATLSQPMSDVPATEPPEKKPAVVPPAQRPGEPVPPTLDEPKKPFKVYRESYEVDETQPPPTLPPQPRQPRTAAAAPRPRQAPLRPAAPSPPRAAAASPPQRPHPAAPRPVAPARESPRTPPPLPEEEPAMGGAWVGTLLYLIVMAAGVALAALTLVPYELLRP